MQTRTILRRSPRPARRRARHHRRGVILLVVLAMLTIFTLLGLTLVLVATQARMASLASLRAQSNATDPDDLLRRVFLDVARGTVNTASPIQAHSLLEDLYGPPVLAGKIQLVNNFSTPANNESGQLLELQFQADANYLPSPFNYAYAGLAITITNADSPAAFRSSRIVGSFGSIVPDVYAAPSAPGTAVGAANQLLVFAFDGYEPKPGDTFVVNGRPFSGTGFGYGWNPAGLPAVPLDSLPPSANGLLGAFDTGGSPAEHPAGAPLWYYALLPNHAAISLQPSGAGMYSDPGGPQGPNSTPLVGAGANEPWDAVDYQNMLLAMHYFNRVPGGGATLTPSPSLHRPELIQFWMATYQAALAWTPPSGPAAGSYQAIDWYNPAYTPGSTTAPPGFSQAFPDLARRICLRPLLIDNFQDLGGVGTYVVGDPAFTGSNINGALFDPFNNSGNAWDVDNDGDGLTDSIWIDPGYDVERAPNGKLYKPLYAILCVDMDNKLNLNAHGMTAHLDPSRTLTAPTVAGPYAGTTTAIAPYSVLGTYQSGVYSWRNFLFGQGMGTAEVNLLPLLANVPANYNGTLTPLQEYTQLLQGANLSFGQVQLPFLSTLVPFLYAAPSTAFVNGRYGEVDDPFVVYPGSPNYYSATGTTLIPQYLVGGPGPGRSRQFDPYSLTLGTYLLNDPLNQTQESLFRPFLVNFPPQLANPPGYFFDFLTPTLLPTGTAHTPTSAGSYYDLLARGAPLLDLRGQVYANGTPTYPLMVPLPNPLTLTPMNDSADDPYELNVYRKAHNDGAQIGVDTAGNPLLTALDQPFAPEEGERLYRVYDSDASSLPSRLATLAPSLLTHLQRQSVTTDSWSLPVPAAMPVVNDPYSTQSTELLTYQTLLNTYQNIATAAGTVESVGGWGVADLARARILLRNAGRVTSAPILPGTPLVTAWAPLTGATPLQLQQSFAYADYAVYGSSLLGGNLSTTTTYWYGTSVAPPPFSLYYYPSQPLLSIDTLMGLKLDINRPFGNGGDDNGNAVVDEPNELAAVPPLVGEPMPYPVSGTVSETGGGALTGVSAVALDLNNDGLLPQANGGQDGTNSDFRARQLLARHLYCTMMLLIDDQSVLSNQYLYNAASLTNPGSLQYPTGSPVFGGVPPLPLTSPPAPYTAPPGVELPGPVLGPGVAPPPPGFTAATVVPPVQAIGYHAQAAYLVAQWAINAVDFRDADSIMTPFEFDINPFVDDDGNAYNGTWDVDDVVTPFNPVYIPAAPGAPNPFFLPIPPQTPPGVYTPVSDDSMPWRGQVWGCERPELLITETLAIHDRGTADTNQAQPIVGSGAADTFVNPAPSDTTFDQVRRPRGSLAVELFNPNSPSDAPSGDLYTLSATSLTGTGVNLQQISPGGSPVWRLAVPYSPQDAPAYYTYMPPGGMQQLDPRAPTLPSAYLHRIVYFVPQLTPITYNIEYPANNPSLAYNVFFANEPAITASGAAGVVVGPNEYALVGPAVTDLYTGIASIYVGARVPPGAPAVTIQTTAPAAGGVANPNNYPAYLNMTAPNAGVYDSAAAGANGGIGVGVGPYSAPGNVKTVVGVPIATNLLGAVAGGYPPVLAAGSTAPTVQTTLRFSVSEPEIGYPIWPVGTGSTWDDGYYYVPPQYPTTPFDAGGNGVVPNPHVAAIGSYIGWVPAYTTVYLQRLANPLAPWDMYANPYITVDSMPVDLTSYTGEPAMQGSPNVTGNLPNPEPAYPSTSPPAATPNLEARSRGDVLNFDRPNLWAADSTDPTTLDGSSGQVSSLQAPLTASTPGYLNRTFWTLPTTTWNLGFYNLTLMSPSATSAGIPPAQYVGDPLTPFPWLTWNNRPYANQYELMLVPASSPSSLASDFGLLYYMSNGGSLPTPDEKFIGTTTPYGYPLAVSYPYNMQEPLAPLPNFVGPTTATTQETLPYSPFPHLLNFHDSQITNRQDLIAGTLPPATIANSVPPFNWSRIFEYVYVPSRFTGAQQLLNPNSFTGTTAVNPPYAVQQNPPHAFHPPFNWLSQYREPGRINLNTLFDPVVFEGLMDDFPGWTNTPLPTVPPVPNVLSNLWQGIIDTRQGYSLVAAPPLPVGAISQASLMTATNPVYPTRFANPFRPESASVLAPPTMVVPPLPLPPLPPVTVQTWQLPGQGINATLLRSNAPNASPGFPPASPVTSTTMPLFDAVGNVADPPIIQPLMGETQVPPNGFDPTNALATYSAASGAQQYRHAGRNPYFQYQAYQKLGNTASTQSNVYAIWITVGFFEVTPTASPAHPDGYMLGQEVGSDTGKTQRHRAFFLFDRSVPMGFQRGQDLNVEDGVLIERMIE